MQSRLIVNPSSGPWDIRSQLPIVLSHLEDQGWRTSVNLTEGPGEATRLARLACDEGLDAVFVVGGDGTINEVVNGLAGTPVAMGVLPAGTGNAWAKQLGLPTRSPLHWMPLVDAVKVLVPGAVRQIDVGRSNGRYFLQWTGIGLDAEVTYAMEPRTRVQRHLGVITYFVAGFSIATTMAGARTRIWIDGQRIYRRSILVVISNCQMYGGRVRIATDARLDDGLLDVDVFSGSGLSSALRTAFGVITGLHVYDPRHTTFQGKTIRVETHKPMAVHVDGEPFGTTPLECEVVPKALRVMIPLRLRPSLFVA